MLAALEFYPTNDFGPVMKGLIIGGMGIFHVFLAEFAIGGGLLLCYFQWLAHRGKSPHARQFLDGYFKALVLISFVIGALTGVGMWFTSIQISAPTIGLMVNEFHWMWAIEWTFFCLEVVSGYCFYRYGPNLSDRSRMILLGLYTFAAWGSLFWINGILSWQLTPGQWNITHSVWDGFFNPSFWPSLWYRTASAMAIAALAACVVINTMKGVEREDQRKLINQTARFLLAMIPMPLLGLWYFAVLPEDSREWVMGGSPAMSMFLAMSVGSSLLIGGYALIGLLRQRLYINGATATLLVVLAFGASAGGEFVREGVRKPYTVRGVLFSNSITPAMVADLRVSGSVTNDPYPLRDDADYPRYNNQLRLGAKVFRLQCSICHTYDGANGLSHLTGTWSADQMRMNIAQLQRTKAFMPPFAGSPEELEALVQLLRWRNAGRPDDWPVRHDPATLAQIQRWLDQVGPQPSQDPQFQQLAPEGAPATAAPADPLPPVLPPREHAKPIPRSDAAPPPEAP
ncbi:MAG TPA: c-type cytochrome [Planctomycetota bacterium]|nr:c-type cytochrome [Planctomycetota bacterium]